MGAAIWEVGAARPARFATKNLILDPEFHTAQVDEHDDVHELRDYIQRSHASGFNITEEEVNLQSKVAFPP
jgi:hypothetical protein